MRMGGKLGSVLVLVLVHVAMLVLAVAEASPTPPSSICNVKVSDLAMCIPAITGKSPPPPSKSCCSVMCKVNLRCLCNYKSEFRKFGIDPANAIALPRKCGIKLPKDCKKKMMH